MNELAELKEKAAHAARRGDLESARSLVLEAVGALAAQQPAGAISGEAVRHKLDLIAHLAELDLELGRTEQSLSLLEESLDGAEGDALALKGRMKAGLWKLRSLEAIGELAKAEEALGDAVDLLQAETSTPEEALAKAEANILFAGYLMERSHVDDARQQYEQALEETAEAGSAEETRSIWRSELAEICFLLEDDEAGSSHLQTVTQWLEKQVGVPLHQVDPKKKVPAKLRLFRSAHALRSAFGLPGDPEPLLRSAVELYDLEESAALAQLGFAAESLADHLESVGEWAASAQVMERFEKHLQAKDGQDAISRFSVLNRLGITLAQQDRVPEAAAQLEEAVRLARLVFDEGHPSLAHALINRASIELEPEPAPPHVEVGLHEALTILTEAEGAESEDVAIVCSMLGTVYLGRESFEAALQMFEAADAIREGLGADTDRLTPLFGQLAASIGLEIWDEALVLGQLAEKQLDRLGQRDDVDPAYLEEAMSELRRLVELLPS